MKRRGLRAGRGTLALGAVATLTTVAVVAVEVARVWRRGSAPLPAETDDLVGAAEEVVAETAEVVVAGYREVSTRENALFNLLTSFVTTFIARAGHHHPAAVPRLGRAVPGSRAGAEAHPPLRAGHPARRSSPAGRRS